MATHSLFLSGRTDVMVVVRPTRLDRTGGVVFRGNHGDSRGFCSKNLRYRQTGASPGGPLPIDSQVWVRTAAFRLAWPFPSDRLQDSRLTQATLRCTRSAADRRLPLILLPLVAARSLAYADEWTCLVFSKAHTPAKPPAVLSRAYFRGRSTLVLHIYSRN